MRQDLPGLGAGEDRARPLLAREFAVEAHATHARVDLGGHDFTLGHATTFQPTACGRERAW